MVEGFVGSLMAKSLDNAVSTPQVHKTMWEMCCSDERYVALAAPRGHAKSTAITVAYTLCEVLFRQSSFVVLVSATEGNAAGFLDLIKKECTENEDLITLFGIKGIRLSYG